MNEVIITLKNNRKLTAVVIEGGLYQATLADGKVKFYTRDQLRAVSDEVATRESEIKEGKMKVHHYMQNVATGDASATMRFIHIDEDVPASLKARYEESVKTHRPAGDIMAINTGTWTFSLLEWNMMRNNKASTMMIISNEDLAKFSPMEIRAFTDKSIFAYANASFSFFLKVKGVNEWGLGQLNLDITFAKKSAKRSQEIGRLGEMNLFLEDDEMMKWSFFESDKPVEYYDGMSVISRSFAIRIARGCNDKARRNKLVRDIRTGKLVRVVFRMLTASGLIKGDAIIVPDDQMAVDAAGVRLDLLTHFENMKNELTVEGSWVHLTMWEHATSHMAVWDDQSTINFAHALPESKHISDIRRLYTQFEESLEIGEMPKWMVLGERDRDENGVPDMEKLSDSMNLQWIKAQAHGLDIRSLANLPYLGLGGMVNRMKTSTIYSKHAHTFFHKKMWVPMTNAILAAVITWEAATEMGGYTFPGRNPNTVFFDERVGLVVPGKRFLETFDAHGTWDLDDTVKAIVIKLWASGDIDIHRGITIPADMVVPTTEEEAIDRLLLVRSPNGPGEYSIEHADFKGMFNSDMDMVDENQITVVDLSKMSLPQVELLKGVSVSGVPTSTVYSRDTMTRDDAHHMVEAQMSNPNVGRFCNAMIMWAAVSPGFPSIMLDVMGNIVDACQQGFDSASFAAIEEEPANIFDQVVRYIKHNNVDVDIAIAATRMPAKYQEMIKGHLVAGRFTRVQNVYKETIQQMITQLQNKTLSWRKGTEVVQRLRPIVFGNAIAAWADKFYMEFSSKLAVVDAEHKVDKDAHAFVKMNTQYGHKIAMEGVVAEMVQRFMDIDDESVRYAHVVGLYKWIVLANHVGAPLGKLDRIICQSGGLGNLSVLDILIEGFYHYGLLP